LAFGQCKAIQLCKTSSVIHIKLRYACGKRTLKGSLKCLRDQKNVILTI
jgi:hypothetical protein